MSKKKITRNILLLLVGLSIFVFLIAFKLDLSSFVSTISGKISRGFYAFISLLIILQLFVRSFRFNLLFNRVFEDKISLKDSFLLTGASFFVALATPGKLGDTTRGLFFRKKGIEITAITLVEYSFDTIVIVGIALWGSAFIYRQHLSKILLVPVLLVAGLVSLFFLLKYSKFENLVNKFSWYEKIQGKIKLLVSHIKTGIKSRFVLSIGFIFSCLFISTYFLIFYLVLCRLGANVSITNVLFCAGVGMLIGTLTFIPMGMGTRDASTYGLLCLIGIEPEIAISSVVIMRSLTIPLILVCSLCYMLAINRFADKE